MRFKGTLLLLLICAGFGAYVYFYEIQGSEKREKAKQEEKQLWKVESSSIQQLDIIYPDQHITAVRTGDNQWKITAPRALEADSEELNRLASSAADISKESTLETAASDPAKFGLNPAEITVQLKTKDGKDFKIRFGSNNPTGSSAYAALEGRQEVFLVSSYVATNFKKKLEDLRNRAVLNFDQFETQSVDLKSEKGEVHLVKENDRWWIQGKERWPADGSAVSGVLGALSNTKLKEFFEEDASQFASLGFEKPLVEVRLAVGKNKGIKRLTVGLPKSRLARKGQAPPPARKKIDEKAEPGSELYVARDESRSELFFVEKEMVDKILKSPTELRDKALASFQRFDIDVIVLKNSKGDFTFTKSTSGDWTLGDAKKKTKWDAVNGILDALEKPVKEFVENPAPLATLGLEPPTMRVVLKQGGTVKVDAGFGKEAKDGVYAHVNGESSVKIAEKEVLDKLNKGESDLVEPPAPPTPASPHTEPQKK